jgi:hypothetical protein
VSTGDGSPSHWGRRHALLSTKEFLSPPFPFLVEQTMYYYPIPFYAPMHIPIKKTYTFFEAISILFIIYNEYVSLQSSHFTFAPIQLAPDPFPMLVPDEIMNKSPPHSHLRAIIMELPQRIINLRIFGFEYKFNSAEYTGYIQQLMYIL